MAGMSQIRKAINCGVVGSALLIGSGALSRTEPLNSDIALRAASSETSGLEQIGSSNNRLTARERAIVDSALSDDDEISKRASCALSTINPTLLVMAALDIDDPIRYRNMLGKLMIMHQIKAIEKGCLRKRSGVRTPI